MIFALLQLTHPSPWAEGSTLLIFTTIPFLSPPTDYSPFFSPPLSDSLTIMLNLENGPKSTHWGSSIHGRQNTNGRCPEYEIILWRIPVTILAPSRPPPSIAAVLCCYWYSLKRRDATITTKLFFRGPSSSTHPNQQLRIRRDFSLLPLLQF